MTPERVEEIRAMLTKMYDHVHNKRLCMELLAEVDRLRAETDGNPDVCEVANCGRLACCWSGPYVWCEDHMPKMPPTAME